MKFELPKIYPITDTRILMLSHPEQIKLMIEGGAKLIQLRDKQLSSRELFEQAKQAIGIARPANVKIIINDRVDIALILNADGVHLGQTDISPGDARRILGDKMIIGYSTHDAEQARKALDMPIDYLAIGPVNATKTKDNSDKPIGLTGVQDVRQIIGDFPLVAIGGIKLDDTEAVLSSGADSVAIISDLLSPPEKIAEKLLLYKNVGRS